MATLGQFNKLNVLVCCHLMVPLQQYLLTQWTFTYPALKYLATWIIWPSVMEGGAEPLLSGVISCIKKIKTR